MNWLTINEMSETDREFRMVTTRGIAGVAYHSQTMEVGLAYTSEVQESDTAGPAGGSRPT